MTQGIYSAQQCAADQMATTVGKQDWSSDGGKSGASSNVGPAVQLSLTNVKNDKAQGDPDGDGH